MQRNTLLAALVAAVFAFPIAATAGGKDKHAAANGANGANDGGAAAMFKSMDKDSDGFISKDEAAGTPHAADFASLDKNGDGKLSSEEHYNAKEHVAARNKANGSAGSASGKASSSTSSSSAPGNPGSGKTY
jgi:hypothetical protein